MKSLLEKIKSFFCQPSREDEIEVRFYRRLEDMKVNPEKYKRSLKRKPGQSKIPPVSLF